MKKELAELGFSFPDSKTNFIFATHPNVEAKKLFEALKEAGIFVRYFSKPERISNYLRITIGTDEEMKEFVAFVEKYLNQLLPNDPEIDTIILGCTHYPLLQTKIEDISLTLTSSVPTKAHYVFKGWDRQLKPILSNVDSNIFVLYLCQVYNVKDIGEL